MRGVIIGVVTHGRVILLVTTMSLTGYSVHTQLAHYIHRNPFVECVYAVVKRRVHYQWQAVRCYHQCYYRHQQRRAFATQSNSAGETNNVAKSSSNPYHSIPPYRVPADQHRDILSTLTQDQVRNFSIIAHIDHGKSTLADRLLELTGNISPLSKEDAQVLDKLQVERDRGITVKAQSASMFYHHTDGNNYVLNLIDTPGHVDFSYEVSRSLAACTGALLLVDASQGIQAQTIANYHTAKSTGLDIIPVLTKIDLQHADINRVKQQLLETLNIDSNKVIALSSKTGENVEQIFPSLIQHFAPPMGDSDSKQMRALLFDIWYDHHRGVVCLFHIVDGQLNVGDHIASYYENNQYEIIELGLLMPQAVPCQSLKTGQTGYVIANIRNPREARLGDTFYTLASKKHRGSIGQSLWQSIRTTITPLPGFQPARSMVFAGLFPAESSDFESLSDAMQKLLLNDPAVTIEKETSLALGLGFRCGFLGILHMDVFRSRLEDEFNASILLTAPTVPYVSVDRHGSKTRIDSPAKFDSNSQTVDHYLEPFVLATIIAPTQYQGVLVTLCQSHRGELIEIQSLGINGDRVALKYELPYSEIVSEFYDAIKSLSSGYASFDYTETEPREADLVKIDVRINGEPVDALSVITHSGKSESIARRLVLSLKNAIDRQQIEIVIQAAIGAKIIARERLAPFRKDVLIKSGKVVGGGDYSRKAKLLAKQKEGKKRMKMAGNVELGPQVFTAVMKLPSQQ